MQIVKKLEHYKGKLLDNYKLLSRPKGKQYTKDKKQLLNCTCAFDIETTALDDIEQSFMYVWQFAISTDIVIIGRTWEEFSELVDRLHNELNAKGENVRLIIYVHNLSYEMSFLKGQFNFTSEDLFAIDNRKIIKANLGKLEFRCSYYHSNMSLKEYTHKFNVEHKKLEDFKYTSKRYSWTKLTKKELDYAINDVLGLVEAINAEMKLDGDTLWTIPLTSTGYVRSMARKGMYKYNHNQLKDQLPTYEDQLRLERAFRGGDVHNNRFYGGEKVANAKGADMSSAYPKAQVSDYVPISEWYTEEFKVSIDWILDLIYKYNKCVLIDITFYNIELANKLWPFPYLSRDKCHDVVNAHYDNGRILDADRLTTTLTNPDLEIILKEYKFEGCEVIACSSAKKGLLPKPLRDLNIELFKRKTSLKGVKGQEIYYMKSKSLLNSIYGLTVQKPIRQPFLYDEELKIFYQDAKDPEALLEKYYRRCFLNYSWGVFTTANNRLRLHKAMWYIADTVGVDKLLYCDTDSIKYIGDVDWEPFNKQIREQSYKDGAFAEDPAGNIHYMGVFEQEDDMKYFKSLGAKKYCYIDTNDQLHLTLAGVAKKAGALELEEHGGIDAFKEGFIFKKAGGNEAKYNDNVNINYKVGDKIINIKDNLYIKPSTYTLSLTDEYRELLEDSELWLEVFKKEML